MNLRRASVAAILRTGGPIGFRVLRFIFSQRPQLVERKGDQDNLAKSPFPLHRATSGFGAVGRRGGFTQSGA